MSEGALCLLEKSCEDDDVDLCTVIESPGNCWQTAPCRWPKGFQRNMR
jgi:hypothetical protein